MYCLSVCTNLSSCIYLFTKCMNDCRHIKDPQQLANSFWYHQPSACLSSIQEAFVAGSDMCGHQMSMKRKLEVDSSGQLFPSGWTHNSANRFRSSTTTMVPTQPYLDCTASLWCTDLCPCGEKRTVSHIVDSCPLSKLNGGLSQLHSADDEAVAWQISYGS